MNAYVIDASVAVKLGVEEIDSERARAIVTRAQHVIAPELVVAEVANALWKKERLGQSNPQHRTAALASAVGAFDELVPLRALAEEALALAVRLRQPVYDCFYLALANARGSTFVTADARLVNVLRGASWPGAVEAL
jgi:predicted nucleic acid-binding protein